MKYLGWSFKEVMCVKFLVSIQKYYFCNNNACYVIILFNTIIIHTICIYKFIYTYKYISVNKYIFIYIYF